MKHFKINLIESLVILILITSCQSAPVKDSLYSENHLDFKSWGRNSDCCTAKGKNAAIASGGKNATKFGIETLKKGGNAVDAAITVAFLLSVERPHSAGIGGGGFMTLHLAKKQNHFIDFRETAPDKATRDMYLDSKGHVIPDASTLGANSIATPGFVTGLFEIHKKWGRLPWADLIKPAIETAEKGFPVYLSLAEHIIEKQDCLLKDKTASKILFKNGKALEKDDFFIQKDLAASLREIAAHGGTTFRTGLMAKKISSFVKSQKGILTANDFKNYQVKYRKPIQGKWKEYEFISAPPPSAGGIVLAQVFKVLDKLSLEKYVDKPDEYIHLLTESLKRAYALRSEHIGDPDFYQVPIDKLLSDETTTKIASLISMDKATPAAEILKPISIQNTGNHTTHFSIIDKEGNAVASTLTINNTFGSCLIAEGTGVFLNDEMDDFSVKAGTQNIYGLTGNIANSIAPRKRPVSSMSPTLVFENGKPILSVGAAGGSRIITTVLQIILNDILLYKNDVKQAMFAPRIHHQWLPDVLNLETGFSENIENKLKSKGQILKAPPFSAVANAVGKNQEGGYTAVFDPRDEGAVEAY